MEQPLANLARAQDELRNALSVNLGELRSAHDGVAAAAANALRERRREREESRTALEREASERARLETKLTQCETALRETKAALGEARSEAKEVSENDGEARRDAIRTRMRRRRVWRSGEGRGGGIGCGLSWFGTVWDGSGRGAEEGARAEEGEGGGDAIAARGREGATDERRGARRIDRRTNNARKKCEI